MSRISVEAALPQIVKARKAVSRHSKQVLQAIGTDKDAKAPASSESAKERKKKVDAKLNEFLDLMQPRSKAKFWGNDDTMPNAPTPIAGGSSLNQI